MSTLKAVRGTRDLLPPETALWNRIEATARSVFARYNFGEIRTPIFEDTGLFARGVGEETDIVSKEMYTWEDRARAAVGEDAVAYPPPREHGRRGARLYRTQAGRDRPVAEALLHRAAVPARASAEGALPPIFPDRRGDHRASFCGQRIAVARCGDSRNARHVPRRAGYYRLEARNQLRRVRSGPRPL